MIGGWLEHCSHVDSLILRFQTLNGLIVPDPHLDQEKYLIRKGVAGADWFMVAAQQLRTVFIGFIAPQT